MMSQTEMVLQYMHENGSITQMQAIMDIGCGRLSARIKDIKDKLQVPVKTEMVPVKKKNGKIAYVARYSILKEE
jgi:hypothetical protein